MGLEYNEGTEIGQATSKEAQLPGSLTPPRSTYYSVHAWNVRVS